MLPDDARQDLDTLDATYARLHTAKEEAFWAAKMGLAPDASSAQAELDAREIELRRFLQDPARLARTRELSAQTPSPEEQVRIDGWTATFRAHVIESAEARA